MKAKKIIFISIIGYIIGFVIIFFGVRKYVEHKESKLRGDIYNHLSEVFDGKEYIDVNNTNRNIGYQEIPIPRKPIVGELIDSTKSDIPSFEFVYGEQDLENWLLKYDKLNKLYHIRWPDTEGHEFGWSLLRIGSRVDHYFISQIFPYQVGYFKQESKWANEYLPSVQSAIEDAFEFFTKNTKSSLIEKMEVGSYKELMSELYDYNNEYYHITTDSIPVSWSSFGESINSEQVEWGDRSKSSYYLTAMYNGYYKVFVAESQPQTFSIKKRLGQPDIYDLKRLLKIWIFILTALLLIIITPLWLIEVKQSKRKNESLLDKLKRLCNPASFLKDYDKEKIDIANNIYQKLLTLQSDDNEALLEIQKEAVNKLGISLINKEMLHVLKNKVNPKNYMKPYDAEKVTLANNLYARLSVDNISFEEFLEIERLSEQL